MIEESNPRLLAFNNNELDLVDVPRDLVTRVLDDNNRLLPAYAKQGVTLQRAQEAGLAFFAYFNMNDPVVGGYTPEKIALRRALLMGYNPAELIQVGLQGQGIVANQPIPPEVPGHVAGLKNSTPYDPALARALLDKFGYKDRDGDGFRELPDGKPLVLSMGSAPTGENRIRDELWLKNMREHRRAHRVHASEVAGPRQDGARGPAADVAGRLDRDLGRLVHGALPTGRAAARPTSRSSRTPNTTSSSGNRARRARTPSATGCTRA